VFVSRETVDKNKTIRLLYRWQKYGGKPTDGAKKWQFCQKKGREGKSGKKEEKIAFHFQNTARE